MYVEYIALMKVVQFSHFCSLQVGKCDKKVHTSFIITFSLPKGRKM